MIIVMTKKKKIIMLYMKLYMKKINKKTRFQYTLKSILNYMFSL